MMNSLERSYKSMRGNAQGNFFEQAIEMGCNFYREKGTANIHKTHEPFRVLKKLSGGKFQGQFVKKAEPDFKGVLKNGISIVFECKYTSKEKISKSILSENQAKELRLNSELGAVVGVCVCFSDNLRDRYFFVPWYVWDNIEKIVGKKSVSAKDLWEYEVFFKGYKGIDFLEHIIWSHSL